MTFSVEQGKSQTTRWECVSTISLIGSDRGISELFTQDKTSVVFLPSRRYSIDYVIPCC